MAGIIFNQELWQEQFNSITSSTYGNVAVYVLSLAIGMYIVWYLYKKIANRDMFSIEMNEGKGFTGIIKNIINSIMYIFKYGVLFPVYTFGMFLLLATSLFFLSTGVSIEMIMLMTIVIISVVRLLAYVNEETAQELSKMVPFAMIAFFITNPNISNYQYNFPDIALLTSAQMLNTLSEYVIFLIGLELGLRLLFFVFMHLGIISVKKKSKGTKEKQKTEKKDEME